jgi:hypothetical protein
MRSIAYPENALLNNSVKEIERIALEEAEK